MTTDTLRHQVDSHAIASVASGPVIDNSTPSSTNVNKYVDQDGSEEEIDFQQVIFFLAFTVKESIQQTLYSFLQDFKCTHLLLRELHKPYIDTIRVLVPLWLTVLHVICLVVFVLAHKIAITVIARLRETSAYHFHKFTTWTEHHTPRVFRLLACHFDAVLSSVLRSDPSSTTQH